ncbi:MAG TPA: class I SAM-dependent methyltransferase [Chthoniobacterales bacterium]|nr:class I SAM-dependent methyltransferase [Chthoniobacterales bacterium]
MRTEIIHGDLPSRHFEPRIYGVGAWTSHLHFAYDLVALLKPAILVELGVDRGESYFGFCQSALENETGTQCFGVDTWRGDRHAGGYDETTFAQVSEHNRPNYESFSTLIRSGFDEALHRFAEESIDVIHLDGLHTEDAVRHDLGVWLPKLRPGGILLVHDVDVQSKGFGVWKVWTELQQKGRSWTFHYGPGLGVWQKPPPSRLPGFLEQLLAPPNESNAALATYYSERGNALQEKIAQHWRDGSIRQTPFAQQTIIQVFYSSEGSHSEANSVYARVGHEGWKDLRIELPHSAGAAPLRIDFVSAFTTIEIASIAVIAGATTYFCADNQCAFEAIAVRGDAERLPDEKLLRLQITGIDPQLYLPEIDTTGADEPLVLRMRLRVIPSLSL